MEPKCIKCENTKFDIKKREDQLFCYIVCSECGTISGVLEDIDFKKHNNLVTSNHGFFVRKINELEEQLKEVNERNNEMFEMIERVMNTVGNINKKIN